MTQSKHVVKFREAHLQPSEEIVAWGEGYIGEMMGSGDKTQHNGVLIITNERVVFYRKGIFGEVLQTIPLNKITSIKRTSTMFHRRVCINASQDKLDFKTFDKKKEQEVVAAIEARRAELESSELQKREHQNWISEPTHKTVENSIDLSLVQKLEGWNVYVSEEGKLLKTYKGKLVFESTRLFVKGFLGSRELCDLRDIVGLEENGQKFILRLSNTYFIVQNAKINKKDDSLKEYFSKLLGLPMVSTKSFEWTPAKVVGFGVFALFLVIMNALIPEHKESAFSNNSQEKVRKLEKRPRLVPYQVVREDQSTPLVFKAIRHLLVEPKYTKHQVSTLLRWYYHDVWKELQGESRKKLIFIYIYDSIQRYRRGTGEWIAMTAAGGFSGKVTEWPRITLRVPDYKNAPSLYKQEVYERVQDELGKKVNLGKAEDEIQRRVAKQLRISKRKLDKIWMEVYLWRSGIRDDNSNSLKRKSVVKRKGAKSFDEKYSSLKSIPLYLKEDRIVFVRKWIVEAQDLLLDKKKCENVNNLKSIWNKIKGIKKTDKNFIKVKRIVRKLEKCRKELQKHLVEMSRNLAVLARDSYVSSLNQQMSKTLGVLVSSSGPYKQQINYKIPSSSSKVAKNFIKALRGSKQSIEIMKARGFTHYQVSNLLRSWKFFIQSKRKEEMQSRKMGQKMMQNTGLDRPFTLK